ncbi:MAG: (2Fe-2S)-binding protein [Planctomycetes bacterium]|nr:(2Fe-2S)-binding protein [Planctomycetota bacterium]
MNDQDDICVCFHVSLGKLAAFARREKPTVAAKMAECLGAGTGCGWCVPTLCEIARQAAAGEEISVPGSPDEYRANRRRYKDEKKARESQAAGTVPPTDDRPAG